MATELGQAYVQIMPSAKGISGSIQKAINPEATKAGKGAGTRIATNISNSMGKMGKTLTKSITLPVAGAVTAVGGLVSALGFKRLVSVDTARGQLEGLGYSAKDVERISGQLSKALEGGMMTMGEATAAAANGMAAGVKEGKELTKYIQLLDSAVVGGTGTFDEMNQIFAQTADLGHLTSNNFDMMAMRMPGFSSAMQKHMGVSGQAFRDMLNSGDITLDEFLNLMDDFAGDMAGAYSKTWSGMVQNTLAYVGIIGEALLEGLFEDGKEALAGFVEVLSSDEVLNWATETGEKIREVVSNITEVVKDGITWWNGLSDSSKELIGIFAGVAVAAGPILLALSKIMGVITSLAPLFKLLGAAIAGISWPIAAIVAAIIGAAALIYVYWEPIKEFFMTMWESIKETAIGTWDAIMEYLQPVIQAIVDFAMDIWGVFTDFWMENGEMIMESVMNVWGVIQTVVTTVIDAIVIAAQWLAEMLWEIMQFIWPAIEFLIVDTWNAIKNVISGVIDVILGIIKAFGALFTGDWSTLWESIKQILSGVVQALWGLINLWFVGKILKLGKTFFKLFKGVFTSGWNSIRSLFTSSLNAIRSLVSSVFNAIRSVISSIMNGVRGTISSVTGSIRSTFSNIFNALKGIVTGAFNGVKSAVTGGMRNALSAVTNMVGKFKDAGKRIVTSIADGIKGAIGKVTGAISDVASKVRDFLPFSPPKTGPLMDIMDVKWGETISGGIVKGEGVVADAMDSMLDFDLTKKSKFTNYQTRNNPLLEATMDQNRLLSQLLDKDQNLYVNDREMGKVLTPAIKAQMEKNERKLNKAKY